MSNIKKLTVALGVLALAPLAQATNITLSSAAGGPSVILNNGIVLAPNGSTIRVGTLTEPGNFNSFIDFGTATVRSAGFGAGARASKVTGEVVNGATADNAFDNRPIYIWIYNATDITLPPAGAARDLVEQGLFQSTVNFPANDDAGFGDDIQVQATTFLTLTPVNLPWQGPTQASVSVNGDNLQGGTPGGRFVLGAVIPEPSTSLLAAGALLAMARRRRK